MKFCCASANDTSEVGLAEELKIDDIHHHWVPNKQHGGLAVAGQQNVGRTPQKPVIPRPGPTSTPGPGGVGKPDFGRQDFGNEGFGGRAYYEQTDATELLINWSLDAAEKMNVGILVKEFIGQMAWFLFGPFALPLLLPFYTSAQALKNRGMWPGKVAFMNFSWMIGIIFGFMMSSVIIIYAAAQPEDTHPIEVMVIIFFIFLRCVTIAIKYAYIPVPMWYQLREVQATKKRLAGWLILLSWRDVKSETANMYADLSFLTITSNVDDGPCLRFLPWPRGIQQLSSSCHMQGRVTREEVAKMMLNGSHHVQSQIPTGFDFTWEIPRFHDDANWSFLKSPDHAPAVPLRVFFKELIDVVLEAERESALARNGPRITVLVSVIFIFLPCIGRVLEDKPFLGRDLSMAISLLSIFPLFPQVSANLGFLHCAVLDMSRRRSLVRCCAALLSTRPEDRTGVPWKVTALPVLDLRDPETVKAFWLLRGMCMDWGKIFSLRCARFSESFAASCCGIIIWFLILIETQMYDLISRTLILIVLTTLVLLGGVIVALAVIGDGVNSGAARLGFLLDKHASGIQTAVTLYGGDNGCDPETMTASAELIGLASADIVADQEAYPVKLLGMYCGFSLLSALYTIPIVVGMRVAALCGERPDLCGLEPNLE